MSVTWGHESDTAAGEGFQYPPPLRQLYIFGQPVLNRIHGATQNKMPSALQGHESNRDVLIVGLAPGLQKQRDKEKYWVSPTARD